MPVDKVEGVPSAQQVVDRWHLLKNLREVFERVLGRVHETLKQRQLATGLPVRPRAKRRRSKNEQMAAQMARLRREARYADVVALYRQGVSIVRIAEDLHMSRTTVRKFVAAGAFPERASTLRSKSILDPYIPYLQQRLAEGPTNASQLWRDVRKQGFLCSSDEERLVTAFVPALEEYKSPPRLITLTRAALIVVDESHERARRRSKRHEEQDDSMHRYELATISSAQLRHSLLGSSLSIFVPQRDGKTQQHVIPFHSPAIAWFLPLFTRLRLLLTGPYTS
jgi:hypothetical protein